MIKTEKRLGADRASDLIRLESHLEPLARYLNAPGDWGYGTILGDLTLQIKEVLHEVRCAREKAND